MDKATGKRIAAARPIIAVALLSLGLSGCVTSMGPRYGGGYYESHHDSYYDHDHSSRYYDYDRDYDRGHGDSYPASALIFNLSKHVHRDRDGDRRSRRQNHRRDSDRDRRHADRSRLSSRDNDRHDRRKGDRRDAKQQRAKMQQQDRLRTFTSPLQAKEQRREHRDDRPRKAPAAPTRDRQSPKHSERHDKRRDHPRINRQKRNDGEKNWRIERRERYRSD